MYSVKMKGSHPTYTNCVFVGYFWDIVIYARFIYFEGSESHYLQFDFHAFTSSIDDIEYVFRQKEFHFLDKTPPDPVYSHDIESKMYLMNLNNVIQRLHLQVNYRNKASISLREIKDVEKI